ncbi:MAG TPA: proteasome accessory factor PafA2 family protein [Streptosporangiaceae bacterium]|nr:proteasome accessory factor PafA2 family protein [Streptosporangiaceae bacterium]
MDKRIFGLESEYGVTCVFRGQQRLSPDEVARDLFRRVASGGQSSDVLLRNGAQLRLEVASHPKYATPECDNVLDLIAHDKAGERILEEFGVDAQRRLREAGIAADIYLFKTSTDPAGNSCGCRENYQVGRQGEFGRLADLLIPFLVTRQVICGAGKVLQTARDAVYSLSRGPERSWTDMSSARIRPRPLINTRGEPRAGGMVFRRLHVAVSDPNMSETTVLLKLGATDLVLRMIEAGAVLPDLILDNPVRAIGEVSLDLTGQSRVRLADGRAMSALDIQREYLARASDFAARNGMDAASGRVLGMWERVLDAVETGNLGAIAQEIDWVIKYQLIERYRAAHGLPLSSPQIAELDLAYHDVNRDRGGYYLLQRNSAVQRTVRDIDIFEAKTVPPAPGRYRQAG